MNELEAVAARLDRDYRPITESLTDEERDVIKLWQKTNREYQSIQRFLRTGTGTGTSVRHARTITA